MSMFSSTNPASSSSSKTLRSKVEKLIFGGKGLARIDGCATFIPFSAPDDDLEISITEKKKNYQTGKIVKILKKGPGRRPPLCPHFKVCGGCQLQHLTYSTQLEAKRGFIQEALKIDGVNVRPSPEEWLYRSHVRLNLRKTSKGFMMGYIGTDNRSLIEPTTCPIFSDNSTFFQSLKEELLKLPNQGITSASCRLFNTAEGIIIAFSTYPHLPKKMGQLSCSIGTAYKSPGKEKSFGKTTLDYSVAGQNVSFSPYGFMQNNLPLTATLYATLVDWIGETPQSIYDLYCGIGITGALMQKKGHRVTGVELSRSHTPCGTFKIHYGPVEKVLPRLKDPADVTIVNPPRIGLSKEVLPHLKSDRLFYISCMPATLGRDIERLSEAYILKRVEGFDLFPQTTHVETLAFLEKKKL